MATAAARAQPGSSARQARYQALEHIWPHGLFERLGDWGLFSIYRCVDPIASATACDQTFISKYTILQDILPACVLWRRTNPANGRGRGPRSPVVAAGGFRENSRFLIWGPRGLIDAMPAPPFIYQPRHVTERLSCHTQCKSGCDSILASNRSYPGLPNFF